MVENNSVYSKEMETTIRGVEDAMKENREDRISTLGRGLQREKRRTRTKKLGSREGGWEKKIQRQGGKCRGEETDGMDPRKWMGGLNGNKQGDEEGEWTYTDSRGETMIDYGIVNEETWERVGKFRIGERE
jgi:hypothetical protein